MVSKKKIKKKEGQNGEFAAAEELIEPALFSVCVSHRSRRVVGCCVGRHLNV